MKVFIEMTRQVLVTFGGMIGMAMGGCDDYLYALTVFMAVEFITWLAASAVVKKLSREAMTREILKKVVICGLIAVGHIIDACIVRNGSILRTMTIAFYLSYEGICILQNAVALGIPVPEKLKVALEKLRERKGQE